MSLIGGLGTDRFYLLLLGREDNAPVGVGNTLNNIGVLRSPAAIGEDSVGQGHFLKVASLLPRKELA